MEVTILTNLLKATSVAEAIVVCGCIYYIFIKGVKNHKNMECKIVSALHIVMGLIITLIDAIAFFLGVDFKLAVCCMGIGIIHMAIGMLMLTLLMKNNTDRFF